MDDLYIRFMAPVTQQSIERLLNIVDAAYKKGQSRLHLLLNSPGGSVAHGLAVHNILKGMPLEIMTYNFGTVDSIGVTIYCAGRKRYAVPHARFLLHPVGMNVQGNIDEHKITEYRNALMTDQQNIARVIADTVGKTEQDILDKIHSRQTLDSGQAQDFGLVQEIRAELIPAGANLEIVRESEAN